jgi:phospholipid/cholesterol/gamma-HCH transport system permease protein
VNKCYIVCEFSPIRLYFLISRNTRIVPHIHFHRSEQETLLKTLLSPDGDESLTVALSGQWRFDQGKGHPATLFDKKHQVSNIRNIIFTQDNLIYWDSSLVSFVKKTSDEARKKNITVDTSALPSGVQKLLALSSSLLPPDSEMPHASKHKSILLALGFSSLRWTHTFEDTLEFIGELMLSVGRFIRGKAQFRMVDLLQILRDCSANSLPIVTLISFLFGIILAFIGAAQLSMFGAEIYVADLVGIAMAREMGPMMTAILLAGRCGAAFAAQIGTMTVNEEVDALKTTGISPMDFLVLPRILSLAFMTPFLALYSIFMGIIGGAVIARIMLGISFVQFFAEAKMILTPTQFGLGLIKSLIYGILVAYAGCLHGIHCGKSASAVGAATTSAVVVGIIFVVTAGAITTYIYNILGV